MNLDKDKELIYCHICGEWIDAYMETYSDNNNCIKCIKCDILLGYEHDAPEIFGE